MRLFNLTQGKILIDGIDISLLSQKNLREKISFVPQDPVLFHRSLFDNIRYGKRDASDEEVISASRLAHCDKFIDKLPLGYETFVGERGIKLSGGERQRIAIARAILKDSPILVLDEATSALDSESEILIQDALRNLIKNKTTIVIAHRLSTIRAMDRIIIIENGKIIEDDTHDELVKKTPVFTKSFGITSRRIFPLKFPRQGLRV
jgi:ATP-binding cassette, subfamily B, bacterial